MFPEILLHVPLIPKSIPHCSAQLLSSFIFFMVSYFYTFYLVSDSTDTRSILGKTPLSPPYDLDGCRVCSGSSFATPAASVRVSASFVP